MLDAASAGDHALLVAATGAGKTLAGFLPTLADLIEHPTDRLHTLYVSPLKALAVDVQRNLLNPIREMELPIRVETRSGDTPSDRKARQRIRPPQILLTTPESLSLLLSYPDSALLFEGLQTVVERLARERAVETLADAHAGMTGEIAAAGETLEGWLARRGAEAERTRTTVQAIAMSGLSLPKLMVAAGMLADLPVKTP